MWCGNGWQFSEHPNKSPLMGWGSAQINCLGTGWTASQESTVSKTIRLLLTLERDPSQCETALKCLQWAYSLLAVQWPLEERSLHAGSEENPECLLQSLVLETSRNWEACDLWQKPQYQRGFFLKKLQSVNQRSKMEMDLGIRGCQKLTKNLLDNNLHLLIHHTLSKLFQMCLLGCEFLNVPCVMLHMWIDPVSTMYRLYRDVAPVVTWCEFAPHAPRFYSP